MQRREVSSLIFAIAGILIDYLVAILFPSIPLGVIAVVAIALLVIAAILWYSGKPEEQKTIQVEVKLPEAKPTAPPPRLEPEFHVEVCESLAVGTRDVPPSSKRIYFQVTNGGQSTARNCRAVMLLPSSDLPSPPHIRDLAELPTPRGYIVSDRFATTMPLDWYKGDVAPPDDELCLGKSVDISTHPDDIFLAGTIFVSMVEPHPPKRTVNAQLEVKAKSPSMRAMLERPLHELSMGRPARIGLTLSWNEEQLQERTWFWNFQIVSFDDIRRIPLETSR
jgi:hypothetical protein